MPSIEIYCIFQTRFIEHVHTAHVRSVKIWTLCSHFGITFHDVKHNAKLCFMVLCLDNGLGFHKKIQKHYRKICKKDQKYFSSNLSTFSVLSPSARKRSKPTLKWLGCCYTPLFEELSIMVAKSRKLTGGLEMFIIWKKNITFLLVFS